MGDTLLAVGGGRVGVRPRPSNNCVHAICPVEPDEIFWFGQEEGWPAQRSIDKDGLYHSAVFPGLWVDPQASLWNFPTLWLLELQVMAARAA